jgi:hypothetical protein
MQIHELTKRNITEASIADRIAASNVAAGTAQQQEIQAQAAQYAQKLQRQGYGTAATASATGALQPGQRIKVVVTLPNGTQSNYYKTDKGWENELEQPIKNANSISFLEKQYAKRPTVAGAVQPTSAGAVQTGAGAQAVMTSVDVDQAIRQLGLSQEQLRAFQAQATQNPGFVQAFLKRLGLAR